MIRSYFCIFILSCICHSVFGQNTDLSIVAQAQNSSGINVSQVAILENFQYIVTVINTGDSVSNATFEITMDDDLTNLSLASISSQNNTGGATDATNLMLNGSVLTGTFSSLPNDSSVEIKIEVTAPSQVGGIAINAVVFPPDGTTDLNTSNNQSLISIDVVDVNIDFTVTHSQINPTEGTPISSWNSTITYQFTVTNNSAIDFPLTSISGELSLLSDLASGVPNVRLESIECISTSSGMDCPDVTGLAPGAPTLIGGSTMMFTISPPLVFTSGGTLTFEMVYEYLDPSCTLEQLPISVASRIGISLDATNSSPSQSEPVITLLPVAELCLETDICIDTIQTSPNPATVANWNQEVTFETTVCNNGPLDANIAFFLQNLSSFISWEILSVDCTQTTGDIDCDAINISINELFWVSDMFYLPVGATVTITTVVIFLEPECGINSEISLANIRSGTNILEPNIFDSNIGNSAQTDFVMLPQTEACPNIDLGVTKIQIDPEPPSGTSSNNTIQEGAITYEITVSNPSDFDAFFMLTDFTENIGSISYIGTLTAIDCVSTTGSALCFDINNANLGTPLDGVPDAGEPDVFWEITESDNWSLPANSSVTFQATVVWESDCSISAVPVHNIVEIAHADNSIDTNSVNDNAEVITYIAPCVDLLVQTYPEFTQVNTNQNFDWIIDVTNSENSSNAINISFENTINEVFTINGDVSCSVTSGNATCISNLNLNNNVVTGTIDNMDAASTIQIRIPVIAPSFGGAFNNIAIATPNENDNREISPETNTSISNIQVVAPTLEKFYVPDTIIAGQESTLTFIVTNLSSNPEQNDISFIDTFPFEISLISSPEWVTSNGCTAEFIGGSGDNFVGLNNLVFPEGVSECTFNVIVSSSVPDIYINDTTNFSNQNNIDSSQTFAVLTVLEDDSDVDIELTKSVNPFEVNLGDLVTFEITATNLGTTEGTNIEILDVFPSGMDIVSATPTEGIFDPSLLIWTINSLSPGQSATLTIEASVKSNEDLINVVTLNNLDQPDRNLSNNTDEAEVTVPFCLYIPQGFSPNNDGFNDTFEIKCIEDFPDNHLKIYNRLGTLVYNAINYTNDWDGIPNKGFPTLNTLLPVGTYFYSLDLKNGKKPLIGWLYLNY